MKAVPIAALAAFVLPLLACGAEPAAPATKQPAGPPVTQPPMTETQQTATLANGCFWCTEAVFQRIKGVEKVVSGYIGGTVKNPTYDQVTEGTTGHAEAIQITFNPKEVSFEKLLEVFWASHDPTTLNRQGHDVGTQYRSAIFYHSDEQKKLAEESKTKHQPEFKDPIVTEITKADVFYPAEGYHQNYYNLNSTRNPYCRVVIWPKLKKLGLDLKPTE
jgi:peptide-methionine (S)-S-oxide reductase